MSSYVTEGGVRIASQEQDVAYLTSRQALIDRLDTCRGALFASNYEYPGRYNRWEFGFCNPPLMIVGRGRVLKIIAANARGRVLLAIILPSLETLEAVAEIEQEADVLTLTIAEPGRVYDEQERSRTPSVFSVLRAITALFQSPDDSRLGLYGAFGYDLAFQFEPIELKLERPEDQRDLVLFLPDNVLVVDHYSKRAFEVSYTFEANGQTTQGLDGGGVEEAFVYGPETVPMGDHSPGEYAKLVRRAKQSFRRGDLFEVVPGQVFFETCRDKPSEIFSRLSHINPAPFGFLMNLGEQEYLVGASPEMFVRVTGRRVETCPISGTISRGPTRSRTASRS